MATHQGDLKFAQTAIALGFITSQQVAACQRLQYRLQKEGKVISIRDCLIQQGMMTETQAVVVKEQATTKKNAHTTKILELGRYITALGQKNDLGEETQSLTPGQSFGRYKILREAGKGGMARVYKAYDSQLDRIVALKVMISQTQEHIERFYHEARATAKLQHTNIVTVYDIGKIENDYYFTMDFVDGVSLREIIAANTMNLHEIVQIMVRVGKAVHYAHTQGIIHRDLKPSNIMLDNSNRPKITDFGLARVTYTSTKFSESGMIIGTVQYMPPEQARGALDEIDARSDVYSLGAILYEMMTGRPLFFEKSFSKALEQVKHQHPAPPSSIRRKISRELESICCKALEKEKAKRYQSAAEFVEAISHFAQTQRIDLSVSNIRPPGRRYYGTFLLFFLAIAASLFYHWYATHNTTLRKNFVAELATLSPAPLQRGNLQLSADEEELEISGILRVQGEVSRILLGGQEIQYNPVDGNFRGLVKLHYGTNQIELFVLDSSGRWASWSWQVIRQQPRETTSMFRVDAQNSGYLDIEPLLRVPEKKWQLRPEKKIYSLATADNVVYCGTTHELYAWNSSAQLKWQFTSGGKIFGTPAIWQDLLFIGSSDGYMYALNKENGKLQWKFETQNSIVSSPTIVHNTLYFGSLDKHLYAVDIASQKSHWKFATAGRITSSPAVAEGKVCIGGWDTYLYTVDNTTGQLRWKFKTAGRIHSSPAISEGIVCVGSYDHSLYAIDLENGRQRWRFATNNKVFSSPAIAHNKVYFGSLDGHCYCLSLQDGRKIWEFRCEGQVFSSPIVVRNVVYFGSMDGHLYALDTDGKELWRFRANKGVKIAPSVANNALYVCDKGNYLYSLE